MRDLILQEIAKMGTRAERMGWKKKERFLVRSGLGMTVMKKVSGEV
jgi:hypothetical protein